MGDYVNKSSVGHIVVFVVIILISLWLFSNFEDRPQSEEAAAETASQAEE